MLKGLKHAIENMVMAALPKKRKKSLPSVTFDYVSHQDRQTGWLTASDKIGGWARMRTDMDDV